MKIRNVDFDFKPFKADHVQRLEDAMAHMTQASQELKAAPPTNAGESINRQCSIMDEFLAAVLGEDYDTKLGVDICDLLDMTRLYTEFFAAVEAEKRAFEALNSKMQATADSAQNATPTPAAPAPIDFNKLNREQRRTYVRSLRNGGKAGQ